MHTVNTNGQKYTMYDTLDELLNLDLDFLTEYDNYYYAKPPAVDVYDETVYMVNKNTKKVSCISYMDYICDIGEKAKSVSIEELKGVS